MRYVTRNDDQVALGNFPGNATFNAPAGYRTPGNQRARTIQHVINFSHVRVMNAGALILLVGLWPVNAIDAYMVSAYIHNPHHLIGNLFARQ